MSFRNGRWDPDGGEPPGTGEFVAQDWNQMCDYTYLKDQMGNVVGLIDQATGNWEARTYDAFGVSNDSAITYRCDLDHDNGEVWPNTPDEPQPVERMQGGQMAWRGGEGSATDWLSHDRGEDLDGDFQEHDYEIQEWAYTAESTGLVYMQARYYEPETGRFTQADPVAYGWESFLTGQNNRWTYCANDPVNWTDPSGKFWWYVVAVIFIIIMLFGGLSWWAWYGAISKTPNPCLVTDSGFHGDEHALDPLKDNIEEILPPGTSATGQPGVPSDKANVIVAIVNWVLGWF